jgi:carbonic anhydrase/acetyltransferase-like protein (isoleucine patch superfamily)
MATLIAIDGVAPTIGRDVFLAPTAVLTGDVRVGDRASIWFGAVLRGDISHIEIGEETSIQDGAVVHCERGNPTIVGRRVTVGHNALLEGCVIEDGALVGMGATVLHDAHVGAGAIVAAGAVVPDRGQVAAGTLAAGVPAREKKRLEGESARYPERAADEYQDLRERYLSAAVVRDSDEGVPAP